MGCAMEQSCKLKDSRLLSLCSELGNHVEGPPEPCCCAADPRGSPGDVNKAAVSCTGHPAGCKRASRGFLTIWPC